VAGIDWVTASVETALGTVEVEWSTDSDGRFSARYTIPFGVRATLEPPATEASVVRLDGSAVEGSVRMSPGRHEVEVSCARIISPAVPSLP
jgi:hypothetical protein